MRYALGELVFNDWEIVREIGSGASGTVWEIVKRDHNITTSSALKVIQIPQNPSSKRALTNDGFDDASITNYFQKLVNELTDEIKIMIDMKGFPYIVNCEDYKVIKYPDEIKWDILIRMELLTPIQTYMQNHVFSEVDIIKLGKELLETLSLFENKGILHRDIKPDNIFIDNYGNAKIGDFGIARICDKESADLSKKGTENYMAPEVFHGKDYDHTADIYSLGLVLYKLLNNNRLPFYPVSGEYDDWDVQNALIERLAGNKELPLPCSASPEMGKIVVRMCSHDPKERYQTAKEVLESLIHITGSTQVIVGEAASGAAITSDTSKNVNETKVGSIDGMVIHSGEVIKKTNKTGATGQSSEKKSYSRSASINEDKWKREQYSSKEEHTASEDNAANEDNVTNKVVQDSAETVARKKKGIKKKDIIQGMSAAAVVLALILYFLMNKTYALTILGGTGSGTYKGGKMVMITAEDIPGSTFVKWDVEGKIPLSEQELTEKSISFKMPRHELSLKAIYNVNVHKVIINHGTGSGEYDTGVEVTIEADAAEEGMAFDGWDIEDGSVSLEHPDKMETSFVMPDDDVEISANYKMLQYRLQVENGQGSGEYGFNETVKITAEERSGETFSQWFITDGDITLTDDEIRSRELTFSMPAGNISIKANYETNVQEMQSEIVEGASSEAYNDEVTIEKVGTVLSQAFVYDTDILIAAHGGNKYALMDVTDTQLTEPKYDSWIQKEYSWLIVGDVDTQKAGVLSQKGQTVVPCEYDYIDVLSDKWIVAYKLKEASEEDYDFADYELLWFDTEDWFDYRYYQIDTAKIYCVNGDSVAAVEVTRDQLGYLYEEGDYVNIVDRSTGNVTTYDSECNAVASVNSIWDDVDYSAQTVLEKQLEDKTGYNVWLIGDDGYAMVKTYADDEMVYGVINMNGDIVVPLEYSWIDYTVGGSGIYISAQGYFCVKKDDKMGYVTDGGEVSCALKYDADKFYNKGLSGFYKNSDGTYMIVAADGTESGPYPYIPSGYANGLLYEIYIDDEEILVDWHGNELLKGYWCYSFAESGKYFIACKSSSDPFELFSVNGAEVIGVAGNVRTSDNTNVANETESETVQENTSNADIVQLLKSSAALIESDISTNKATITALLGEAKTKADAANSGVASVIGSAVTLLDAESPDANLVLSLVNSAISMME